MTTESPAGVTPDSTTPDTATYGYKITIGNENIRLTAINKSATHTATTARLRTSGSVDIATAAFSGNVATFNETLIADTIYQIVSDSDGGSYTLHYDASMGGYPVAGTKLEWTDRFGLQATQGHNHSIDYDQVFDVTVTPSALTLSLTNQSPTINVLIIPSTLVLALEILHPPEIGTPLNIWFTSTGGIGTAAIRNYDNVIYLLPRNETDDNKLIYTDKYSP